MYEGDCIMYLDCSESEHTAVMAGNGTFSQKSITQYKKTFITQPKHMVFC